jgi:NADPH:quinone reductase-like Zn-dependent oxidoreductase
MFITSENAADLQSLGDLIESGKVVPAVGRTYPLAAATAAVRHLLDGHARRKVVIGIGGSRAQAQGKAVS